MAFDPSTAQLDSTFDPDTATESPDPGFKAGDYLKGLKRGVLAVPGALTGLADIPIALATGERVAGPVADALGRVTGFQPSKWAKETGETFSPGAKAAQAKIEEAWKGSGADRLGNALLGNFDDLPAAWKDADLAGAGRAIVENPGASALQVVESLPAMLAGGAIGKGVAVASKLAPAIAGAIGEGAITAGQQMDQTDAAVDPRRAAATSATAGALTGAIAGGMGRVAQKLGLEDIQTTMAGGKACPLPTSFLPWPSVVETKAFAESLKLRIAVPHELMSWGRISGSAEITAEASYETHGITKLSELRQSFFFA